MILELRDARKSYGITPVLLDFGLKVEGGELLAVLGLNGAGKTTLLKVMAGMTPLNAGHLLWDGRPFRREDLDRRRRLLFVPDTPFLAPESSVLENVALFLEHYEVERDAVFIADLLEDFDLLELAEKPISTLSRGQIYKTGLATLFAVDPDMALLDEPFASGMDAAGLQSFQTRARAAVAEGAAFVYTTQLVELALGFATRVVVINRGTIHVDIPIEELRVRVAAGSDPVLARLMGSPTGGGATSNPHREGDA